MAEKPTFHNIHERLAYCGEDFRIEQGPPLVRAKATQELLSNDKTATHYRAPQPVRGPDGKVIESRKGKPVMDQPLDALGKPIRLGEEMAYLDHMLPGDRHGWYVYERQPREIYVTDPNSGAVMVDPDDGKPLTTVREDNFEERGYFPSREEAEAEVARLSGEAGSRKAKKSPIPLRER